jgi:hypothetical protein
MQGSCKYKSRDSKGGYKVISNAKSLKKGKLNVSDFPPLRVWKDSTGKIWSMDHRRLAAFVLSGVVNEVPVTWTKPSVVKHWKNETKYFPISDGNEIDIINIDKGIAIRIGIN